MEVYKITPCIIIRVPSSIALVTQPNQSFTIRQIIEQFARNEVIPCTYHESDNINDENFTESQMVNNVIEFEDAIDAENHLIENQYKPYEESSTTPSQSQGNQSQHTSEQGDTGTPVEANE